MRLQPFLELGERLGQFLAQMNDGRVKALGVRYYGDLAAGRTDMIANSVLVGLFKPMLEAGVTLVNARTVAHERGIEVIESRSTRSRNYTSLLSVKLHTPDERALGRRRGLRTDDARGWCCSTASASKRRSTAR